MMSTRTSRTHRAMIYQLGALIGLVLAGAAILMNTVPTGSQPVSPETDPFPVFDTLDPAKAMVVELDFNDRTNVSLASAQVIEERAHARIGDPPLLEVNAYDHDGNVVETFNAWHPLWVFAVDASGNESLEILDSGSGTLTFPFAPELSSLTVTDMALVEGGQEIIEVDLDPAISDFCEDNPGDPDCTTNLALSKSDGLAAGESAVAGTELIYTLTISNVGPNPARGVQVVDTLPDGVTFQGHGDTAECLEDPAGTLTCDLFEPLPAGDSVEIQITVLIDADLVYDNGGPVDITNRTQVSLVGTDSDPDNNSAFETTNVVAVADLEILSFEAVDAPGEILIGEPVEVTLEKVITNNGPSGPMDVAIDVAAAVSAGVTATPDPVNPSSALALEIGEERLISESFTLECTAPGEQTFTFTNTIAPLDPRDSDPDLGNNGAQVVITVDCVVPVAINIKPGSSENPINLRSGQGVVPVAVLTTTAGEYGLPLDFDATEINPLSAIFGQRAALFDTVASGATESHSRGHFENALELDESTRDGDLDMVLHFRVQESDLALGDVQACVKGTFTTASGDTFTFFGCDSITVRP